ncbi:MAG: hypothetical protein ACK4FF_06610 [Limnobacter sp.]|uniref:hypothetical protein n=1 Tax=Limnobacter sp. TaxID=2003368 RepID=UPI00391D479D
MNRGKNRGRRLNPALVRFASILITEARELTGLSLAKLDEALDLSTGQSKRYSSPYVTDKGRAPQAAAIQRLEDRVAALLKRPNHKLFVFKMEHEEEQSARPLNPFGFSLDEVIGIPESEMNLRFADSIELRIGYEYEWPDYRRLRATNYRHVDETGVYSLFDIWSWQYGIFWDLTDPCPLRTKFSIPTEVPSTEAIRNIYEFARAERIKVLEGRPDSFFAKYPDLVIKPNRVFFGPNSQAEDRFKV